MKERTTLTREEFDGLLSWLDPDREGAAKKYEEIRLSLIKIFTWSGCADAEDLADETINRVARRLPEIKETYVGNRALYFYGVAKYLRLEQQRRAGRAVAFTPRMSPAVPPHGSEAGEGPGRPELTYECMHDCIGRLKSEDRELLLRYYSGEKKSKDYRKELSRQMGISANSLRVKIKRMRTRLTKCIRDCVAARGGVK